MLRVRCSESEAVLRMRGMPSICSTAQRAPGKAWSESVRGLTDRGRFWPEHPASPDLFVMASAEIDSFRHFNDAENPKGVIRSAVEFVENRPLHFCHQSKQIKKRIRLRDLLLNPFSRLAILYGTIDKDIS